MLCMRSVLFLSRPREGWPHHHGRTFSGFALCIDVNFKIFSGDKPQNFTGQIMGWGHKAIEIRAVETGHLDGVFMHKKAQKLKFLCERNDKVHFCFSCEAYFVNAFE